ncbi:MAG: cysteine synthase family protein [Nitrospinota bacterium]|nr:cysteine synthase family protein [Nitrospinota bacterium]
MSKLAPAAYFKPEEISPEILKRIGGTPLVQIKNIAEKECPGVQVWAKAEWYNASGSVKARAALRMIQEGEAAGLLRPGMTILDSTSGNTGVAYALIGLVKGYKVKLVMPGNVCNERKQLMASSYHAEVVYSDPMKSSDGAILLAREIYQQEKEMYFWPDQYNNPENWKAHFYSTAPEVWEQTNGKVTHFLAGIGTSGTIMGTSRGLKLRNQKIRTYAVEPEETLHGIEGLKHMASSIQPGIYNVDELDGKIPVKTEEAYEMVNRLAQEENLIVGSSGGAGVFAAIKLAKTLSEGVVVTVLPDTCECDAAHGDFLWNREK